MANIKPIGGKILVKRTEAEATTAGGIVLPDSAKEKPKEGKIIALGSPKELIASLGADHVVEFALESGDIPDQTFLDLSFVHDVTHDEGKIRLTASEVHRVIPRLMRILESRGAELGDLTTHHATLEDVFLSLTGRHLRDE